MNKLINPFDRQLNIIGSGINNAIDTNSIQEINLGITYTNIYSTRKNFALSKLILTKSGLCGSAMGELSKGISFFAKKMRDYRNEEILKYTEYFFGICGPGYNYGGATSESFDFTNLNGKVVSNAELLTTRMMYQNAKNPNGFTYTSSYFYNVLTNRNTYISGSGVSPTPGINPLG